MASVQQWGRKESIIWPPRGYVYTLGAFIFACILTGHLHLYSLSIWSFAAPALLPSLLLADRDCRHDSSRQPIPIALCFGRRKGGPGSLGRRRAARLHSPIRRQAIASDAYSRGGEAWRILSDARGPSGLPKQAAPCVDCALDLSGCADLQALHDAARLWPRCVRPAASILNSRRTFGGSRIFAMDAVSKARSL